MPAVTGQGGAVPEPGDPARRHLVAMWVDPARRGQGVADALVGAVVAWAAGQGAHRLALWVVDGNERARRCYARLGFVPSGERQPVPNHPESTESRMVRELSHATARARGTP
ncbi:GNAT family N-acetyltransferase [Actinomycetospora lemnae]|uniref:GNAT family N-acetyltransferase n=1 Tax=Actinomycetospora lemnae TaxID=3019891 RepID=A0ABT5T429_9PSEU|nr:GNAT family N-acetyltransferase [Actinomycetospora sp. DW7H6]MDD7968942.1 GNAT family N-acetyltransferase [Actinomycetospora sp. DW7H6]